MVKCCGRGSVYVAAVFFDLKKAFDRVWHQGLFTKLRAAGIKGVAHEWLVNFLTDRVQVTVVNGTISTSARLFCWSPTRCDFKSSPVLSLYE